MLNFSMHLVALVVMTNQTGVMRASVQMGFTAGWMSKWLQIKFYCTKLGECQNYLMQIKLLYVTWIYGLKTTSLIQNTINTILRPSGDFRIRNQPCQWLSAHCALNKIPCTPLPFVRPLSLFLWDTQSSFFGRASAPCEIQHLGFSMQGHVCLLSTFAVFACLFCRPAVSVCHVREAILHQIGCFLHIV